MTWGEFKQLMTERGVRDDDAVWYIDVAYPEREYADGIDVVRMPMPDGTTEVHIQG